MALFALGAALQRAGVSSVSHDQRSFSRRCCRFFGLMIQLSARPSETASRRYSPSPFGRRDAVRAAAHAFFLQWRRPTRLPTSRTWRIWAGLFLLFRLTQMGTANTARRMRGERIEGGTGSAGGRAHRPARSGATRVCVSRRRPATPRRASRADATGTAGSARRITRAIGERQDLESIFQVVVGSVEEHLPADFAALCG